MHKKFETKLLYFVWIFYHFLTNNLLFDFRQIPMTITLKFIRRLPTSNLIKKSPLLGMLNTCCNIHQMCTDRARESIDISLYYGRIHLQLDRLKIFSPWSHNQVFNWQDRKEHHFCFFILRRGGSEDLLHILIYIFWIVYIKSPQMWFLKVSLRFVPFIVSTTR